MLGYDLACKTDPWEDDRNYGDDIGHRAFARSICDDWGSWKSITFKLHARELTMAAGDHKEEGSKGIAAAHDPKDDISARCAKGGFQAAKTTSGGKPVIREWEYGAGPVIMFSTIDSCLGAVQIAGKDSVRGAHFSMFASGEQYDEVKFGETMVKAGFDPKSAIHYFGGGVRDWEKGLGHSIWWKVRTKLPFADEAQKRWIFEVKEGQLTSATL